MCICTVFVWQLSLWFQLSFPSCVFMINSRISPNFFARDESFSIPTDESVPQLAPRACLFPSTLYVIMPPLKFALHPFWTRLKKKKFNSKDYVFKYSGLLTSNEQQPTLRTCARSLNVGWMTDLILAPDALMLHLEKNSYIISGWHERRIVLGRLKMMFMFIYTEKLESHFPLSGRSGVLQITKASPQTTK